MCHGFVHADRLKRLAAEAEQAERAHDPAAALAAWRSALELLPPESRQHEHIRLRIATLSRAATSTPFATDPHAPRRRMAKGMAGVGVAGMLLWKCKMLIFLVLSKAKLLLLGLSNAGTMGTMLLSFGIYWTAWGWGFAAGLVACIYIHEMGHVAALQRYGLKASAPMFLPGVGAFVQMQQHPADAREDAHVGLAGPWWGVGAALAAYGIAWLMAWPSWAAIAKVAGWITLFNLLPVWQLDGSRAFQALSRRGRWFGAIACLALWWASREGLLVLLALVCAWRALESNTPSANERGILAQYAVLLILSTALSLIHAPVSP